MFSFLKFFNNSKPANAVNGPSGGRKSSDRNGAEAARTFNGGSLVARSPSRTNSFGSSSRDTVLNPGFSFRVTQKAHEVRPSTPSAELSKFSNSYTLENSLNNTSTINSNNKSRDVNDKKRKLMETLDNFGVRKKTRQESGVDAIFYPRRKTISKSYSDRFTPKNTYSYKLAQPISSIGINSINSENKKTERQDDYETSLNHTQKKPRTRNNEILSSYSSSKFLLKPGQKRSHQSIDYEEDEPPARKHCQSCTCCGSTLLLNSNQNNLNKSDKTTETDLSDDLVTVAASRIFNRSGKTQVIKRMPMKTIHDELLDDIDLTPYTSIEKVEAKKKKAQKKDTTVEPHPCAATVTSNAKDSKFQHQVHRAETGVLSARPTIASVSSTAAATPLLERAPTTDTPKTSYGGSSTASPPTQTDSTSSRSNQPPESGVDVAQISNGRNGKTDGAEAEDESPRTGGPDGSGKKDDDKPSSLRFTAVPPSAVKPDEPNATKSPAFQFGGQDTAAKDSLTPGDSSKSPPPPTFTFGAALKPSTAFTQFGDPKADDAKSAAPVLQFGAPKADDAKSAAPVLQFGAPKADDSKSTAPVLQFGAPIASDTKSAAPVLQFGAPKADGTKSVAPVLQFGAPKADGTKSVAPVLQFGAPKASESSSSAPLFSFGSKPGEIAKSAAKPMKFQFGSPKPADAASPQNVDATRSAGLSQNQNLFGAFGKTEPPKYDAVDKPAPAFQFGSSPAFGGSAAANQSKKPADQPKLVFGGQDKPAAATNPGMLFANTGPVFQFNSAAAKPDDKPNASPAASTFAFPAAKPAPPTFSASSPFQFGAPKTAAAAESKAQFSVAPAFGSQTASAAPFKFGGGTAVQTAAPFGSSAFPGSSGQQPLRLTTNGSAEKPAAEPFKFGGAAAPSGGAFKFGGDGKAGNGGAAAPKFGQPNAFSAAPSFGGFGAQQPTSAFGSVPAPQSSPFGNASNAPPAFGGAASPPSNAFGTTQSFQFGAAAPGTSSSSAFAFSGGTNATVQPAKPSGAFNFNAAPPNAASPFQFGSTAQQFGAPQSQGAISFGSPPMNTNGMPGSSQPLFSMGTAPAGERRKVKAVRRRQ